MASQLHRLSSLIGYFEYTLLTSVALRRVVTSSTLYSFSIDRNLTTMFLECECECVLILFVWLHFPLSRIAL
jgi:hypothetical protein